MANSTKITKAIIVPGNGCPGDGADLSDVMWYGWMAKELRARGIECTPTGFPEPLFAFEKVWKDHCLDHFKLDGETLLIGHSSGSACALRLMEEHQTAGCVLVSAYDSDLGDQIERESGYFNRNFDYDKMKINTPFILQFHSKDDDLVPVASGRNVARGLEGKVVYHEMTNDGHFNCRNRFPVILEAIDAVLDKRAKE